MARYNPIPAEWGRNEKDLWVEMVDSSGGGSASKPDVHNDQLLRAMYDTALYNWDITPEERRAVMDTMVDYLWDEYEIDFDDVFDWEGYRDAYDAAQAS